MSCESTEAAVPRLNESMAGLLFAMQHKMEFIMLDVARICAMVPELQADSRLIAMMCEAIVCR